MSIEEQLAELLKKVTRNRSSLVSLRVEIEGRPDRNSFIYDGYSGSHGWVKAETLNDLIGQLNTPVSTDDKRREIAAAKERVKLLEDQLQEIENSKTA